MARCAGRATERCPRAGPPTRRSCSARRTCAGERRAGSSSGSPRHTLFVPGPGAYYRLRQLTSLVPDVLHGEPDRQAIRLVHLAAEIGFEAAPRSEPARLGVALGGTRTSRRCSAALAGAGGRGVLLPALVGTRVVPVEHVDVRALVLARLQLLPRSRDVGHRGVRGATAPSHRPRGRASAARLPGRPASGRALQCQTGRLPRGPVPVGEQHPSWGGGGAGRGGCHRARAPRLTRRRSCLRTIRARDGRPRVCAHAGLAGRPRRRTLDREPRRRDEARLRDPARDRRRGKGKAREQQRVRQPRGDHRAAGGARACRIGRCAARQALGRDRPAARRPARPESGNHPEL